MHRRDAFAVLRPWNALLSLAADRRGGLVSLLALTLVAGCGASGGRGGGNSMVLPAGGAHSDTSGDPDLAPAQGGDAGTSNGNCAVCPVGQPGAFCGLQVDIAPFSK